MYNTVTVTTTNPILYWSTWRSLTRIDREELVLTTKADDETFSRRRKGLGIVIYWLPAVVPPGSAWFRLVPHDIWVLPMQCSSMEALTKDERPRFEHRTAQNAKVV